MLGVFDSGVGGLTVVREIKRFWPGERICYLGDTARVPYGTRSAETIVKFAVECGQRLVSEGVDRLVIACNTASAYAFADLKRKLKVPVFEMIGWGVIGARGGRRIGVIGTQATIRSGVYQRELEKNNPGALVMAIDTPLIVPLVEAGWVEGEIVEKVLSKYLKGMKEREIDTLVLGCTHYPLIEGLIRKILPGVRLINPGAELARSWEAKVEQGDDVYMFTDLPDGYLNLVEMFLGGKAVGRVKKIEI